MSAVPDAPDMLAISRMRRRVRLFRALAWALKLAAWSLGLACLALFFARLGLIPPARARAAFLALAALPIAGAGLSALRRVPRLAAAQLLDAHYALHDRLSSALQFRETPDAQRTPWMDAAIEDAVAHARQRRLEPSAALRWQWPPEARVALALLGVLAIVSLVRVNRSHAPAARRVTAAEPRDALVLDDDDIHAFREMSAQLQRDARTHGPREALREFDRFLDDVSRQRLDRQEAFRRLAALQRSVEESQRADRDAVRESLSELGQRMGDRSEQTRELSDAMQRGDAQRAREEMQRLAEALRRERQLAQQQRQELARALERAAEQRDDGGLQRRLEQARREVEEMLRRQRERALSQSEESLLHRRQRDAQRMQGERDRNEQRRREVEHLRREIAEAARQLAQNQPQQAAESLQRGADELSRMQDEQRSQQSLEELRQRLQELREQMRQQNGQHGQRQRSRLERFSQAAGGQRQPGAGGQQGAGGAGQQGGQRGGQQGGGSPGGSGGAADGSSGQGTGVGLGAGQPGGALPGQMAGAVSVPGGATGQSGGQGEQVGGAGSQHEDNARGSAIDPSRANQVMQVHGQQGNGPSRSQVIRTAASDGFASAPYRQVYSPYWERAREVLHQGEVPAGYRSYVRRYFQLIRPRDER